MACQMIHSWTLSGLVGAFLDLSIAYLLLCASALAFFTSKFLDLFGLSLPCPCDGLFGNPKNNYCFQKQLVEGPSEKIRGVQLQLKSKFPFDVMWSGDPHLHAKCKSDHESGHFEFEGDASCSSFSDGKWLSGVGRGSVSGNEQSCESGAVKLEERLDHKGKKVGGRRPSHGLRRRCTGASVDFGKLFSVSSCDVVQSDSQDMVTPINSRRPFHGMQRRRKGRSVDYAKVFSVSPYDMFQSGARDIANPPSSVSKVGNQGTEVPSSSGMEAPRPERVSRLELNEHVGKTKSIENDASSVENFGGNEHEKPAYDSNDKTMVRVLEQALDEEHTARTALYYELEKERSAAATAADEAMAMILRLQEEKASIEMEARQYQRMIQEKSIYDAEEMNILKEILLRREREKHFLEKEVEYYRKILFGNDQVDDDMLDVAATGVQSISRLPSEELLLMLERTSDSISEKSKLKIANSTSDYGAPSSDSQNRTLDLGTELPVPGLEEGDSLKQIDMHLLQRVDSHSHILNNMYEINHKFQEKGMVSVDEKRVSQGKEVQELNAEGFELVEKTNPPNEHELDVAGSKVDQGSKDPLSSTSNTEPHVHDVHVIDEKSDFYNEKSAEKSEQLLANATLDISETIKSITGLGTEHKVHGVGSDTGSELSVKANGEAEALCGQLNLEGDVDACITSDSDALLFGAKCVIKSFQSNSKEPFECYYMSDIEAGLGLKRKHMVAISLLVGNDHDLNGVQGIGLDTALRFVQTFSEDEILNRLRDIGNGHAALLQGGMQYVDDIVPSLAESSSQTKFSHCSFCGHPGSKKAHSKSSCEYCVTNMGEGCMKKPEGFRCSCSSCDMDRKDKEQKKQENWRLKVLNKIAQEPNFPNEEIIEMYLCNNHGYFSANEGPCISWESPKTEALVDFLAFHQLWEPSYIRQRMLPMLSTIYLREMAENPLNSLLYGQYEFHSIDRLKIRNGHQFYVVKWKRAAPTVNSVTLANPEEESDILQDDVIEVDESISVWDESDDPKIRNSDGCYFMLTDENMDLVQAAFPEEVDRFLQEKELKELKRRKASVMPETPPKPKGVQLNITEFYRSTKTKKLETESGEDPTQISVSQNAETSNRKRKASNSNLPKSVRRRLLFD